MLTTEEIIIKQQEARQRIKVLQDELQELRYYIYAGFQKDCSHPPKYRSTSFGQYMPTETYCTLCNKTLD